MSARLAVRYPDGRDIERQRTRDLAKARKRRLRINAAGWDGISDGAILERDRWRCGICRQRIGRSFRYPHARSASVDHIIPLSQGGSDTQWNKRAAHLGCNQSRHNGRPGEQWVLPFEGHLIRYAPRVRPQYLCRDCGEPLADKRAACPLHQRVIYGTCQVCHTPTATPRGATLCAKPECRRIRSAERGLQDSPAHERGLQAQAMHAGGMSWAEVADRLGYSGPQYAGAAAARATGQASKRRTAPYERQPRIRA